MISHFFLLCKVFVIVDLLTDFPLLFNSMYILTTEFKFSCYHEHKNKAYNIIFEYLIRKYFFRYSENVNVNQTVYTEHYSIYLKILEGSESHICTFMENKAI